MNLLSLAFVSLSVVGVAPTLRAQTENVWPIVPPGDDSLRLAADVPGTSLRWQWSLNGSDWATASGLLPAGGEAAAFQAAPAGTFTPPPSPVPANLPEMTLTIRPIQGDGSVRVTMSRTSPAGTYSRQIGNWRISEDGAAPGPVNGRSFDLDVPASPGPPAYPATRLKVTVYDEWAAWPADTPVSQPPAGFTLEAWDAYTVPLLQSRHAIIEALVKPRPSRYPRLMYQVSAFANDSAYISWRGSDGSRQHSLVTAWPLRDGAGAPLSGLVEWETQGDTEDERRRIEVWVHRQATPFPWQTAAPPPATTPPSTPQLTEEAQEAVAPLLSRREALRHRLLYPVPRTIYEPPPFSDRPATTRQLYRPVFVPSYDRDLIGGGPQGDQPDGVVDWFAGCTHPIITEVCAKNTGSVVDAAGRTPDWVEIYNPTHSPFNLAGWHLTDKANTLPQRLKWTFPGIPATVVPAGGYLIVYAANLGFADPARPLHTNFNLSAEGGNVFLTDPAGVLVDQCLPPPNTPGINFPGQESDWSFGLRIVPGINGGGTVGYGFYTQSTPGTHNTTQGYARQCLAPVVEIWQGDPSQAGSTLLSTNSGVFVPTGPPPAGGAYRVRLRRPATEDVAALVHYTLNAAEPTTWSSFTGTAITLPLDRSAVVRAFTALSGCLDSPSSTCTILFRTDVVDRRAARRTTRSSRRPAFTVWTPR